MFRLQGCRSGAGGRKCFRMPGKFLLDFAAGVYLAGQLTLLPADCCVLGS